MGKSRIRHRAGTPAEADDFFHWHDESPLAALDVDRDSLRELLHPLAYGPPSLKISSKLRMKFRRIMRKNAETIPVRVATLLEACELLNRQPNSLEKLKLFRGRYPIPLDKPEIYNLMTHVINEGSVKKGGGYPRGVYCNLDLSLHERVSKLIDSLGSHGNRRIGKDNVPETYVSISIARLLIKAGLVPGKKTRGQYYHHLPKRILDDHELSRYHMSATLTEEGSPSLRLTDGSRPSISISYSRSIDVSDSLANEYVNSLESKKKYPIGQVPDNMRFKIRIQPFPLLEDEIGILEDILNIKIHSNLGAIYKSKRGRVTVEWRVTLSSAEVISKFKDKIGFLSGSNIESRFKFICKLYEENKNAVLSQEDADRLRVELERT